MSEPTPGEPTPGEPAPGEPPASGLPLPRIRRARGYRLYTTDGRRLLDLYLDGGGALLGHRPDLLGRHLKAVLGRGLTAALPSRYGAHLLRALRQALPGQRWFGVAVTRAEALRLLCARLGLATVPRVADPLLDLDWRRAPVAWWRPLSAEQPPAAAWPEPGPAALVHRLPFALGAGPVTVSTGAGGDPGAAGAAPHLAGADTVSPLLLAGAAVALQRLQRSPEARPPGPAAGWPAPAPGWRRNGVYVVAEFPERHYPAVHAAFLAAGVLLNPHYPGPSILPGSASPGERALLRRLFRTRPGA